MSIRKEVNEKELLINQQKAEILQALAEKLEADKAALEAQSKVEQLTLQLEGTKVVTPEQIESDEKLIVEQIAEISQNIQEENILISSVGESLNTSENTEKPKKKRFGLKERV